MAIELFAAREVRARGESTRGLEAGVRSGRFVRLRPGIYALAHEWTAASADARHRALMDACLATCRREPVFALESAALVHGIPVVGVWPTLPQTVDAEPAPNSRHSRLGTVVHRPRHRVEPCRVGPYLVTGPIDTAIALAASRSLMAGVAAFDHIRARGVPAEDVAEIMSLRRPFHGAARAVRALEISTGLAESVLESISLVPIALAGLPRPEQQVEVMARGRRYRLDFHWPDLGIAGEADGRGKYAGPDDLWQEKRRQDALASVGIGLVRWGWDDVLAGAPMLARLREAGIPFAPRSATSSPRFP